MKIQILRDVLIAALLAATYQSLGTSTVWAASAGPNEPATKAAKAAQIARGAKQWSQTCARCHNLRSPSEYTDKNWNVIVQHMRTVGPIPGQDVRDIRAFLKASN